MGTEWLDDILPTLLDRQVDLDGVLRRIVDETTTRLGADRGASFSLVNSLKLRYDSRPPDGTEKLDLTLKSGVEMSF